MALGVGSCALISSSCRGSTLATLPTLAGTVGLLALEIHAALSASC